MEALQSRAPVVAGAVVKGEVGGEGPGRDPSDWLGCEKGREDDDEGREAFIALDELLDALSASAPSVM